MLVLELGFKFSACAQPKTHHRYLGVMHVQEYAMQDTLTDGRNAHGGNTYSDQAIVEEPPNSTISA